MNKHIISIAKQAGLRLIYPEQEVAVEKFAELLLLDCIAVLQESNDRSKYSDVYSKMMNAGRQDGIKLLRDKYSL